MRSKDDRSIALKLREDGCSYKEIGQKMNITLNSAKSLCTYTIKTIKRKPGPKPKIVKKSRLCIKRKISSILDQGQRVTSPKIMKECNLICHLRTVQKYLKKAGYKYKKAVKQIVLSKKHKLIRIERITHWITNNQVWEETIFSDEKRFSLDGPDDWRSYVSQSGYLVRQKRQCGGGGIMVWMMLMPNGLLAHRIITGKFNSKNYISLLEDMIVPIMKLNFGFDFIFQEDNSPVHKAKIVKDFMIASNICVLDWPPKSPDINIVEDVWGMIAEKVYDGPQFKNNNDLIEKINTTILDLTTTRRECLINLYSQIRMRLCQILQRNGNLYNKVIP